MNEQYNLTYTSRFENLLPGNHVDRVLDGRGSAVDEVFLLAGRNT